MRCEIAEATASSDVGGHLRDVRDGHPLSPEIACQLLTCDDQLLPDLLATARALKEQFRPGVITYSRKVFIPLTNLCRDYCGYCTYRRDPGEPGAHTMTPDEVLAVAQQGEKLGCTEALFSLGDKPETLFPEMRETLRQPRLSQHAALSRSHVRAGAARNAPAAARQSRPAERQLDRTPARNQSQPRTDAGEHQHSPAAGASLGADARQASRAAAQDHRGRRQTRRAVHHRHPDRHRRDHAATASSRCWPSSGCTSGTGTSRKSSSRISA